MDDRAAAVVDVRDMLCAQALALVDRTVRQAPARTPVDVIGNSADVRRDVSAWAGSLGHAVVSNDGPDDEWRMRVQRT